MKLVSSIYQIDDINKLINYFDYALINVPNFSINYKDIDIDLAINALISNNKGIILNINRIFHPYEIDNVRTIFEKYKDLDILYMVADMGVVNISMEYNLLNKIIYNPETLITNYLDFIDYQKLGIKNIGISNEITLDDANKIAEYGNSFYQIFGYRLMFYSRRKLIKLAGIENNINYEKEGYIKEVTRNDYNPILENENNTIIYRPYLISLLKYINNMKFTYLYLESYKIDINIYKDILKQYHDVINNNVDIDKAIENINKYNLNIEDGFIFKDSVYQKEELKNG